MNGKHRVAGLLLVAAAVAACSSSDGDVVSPSSDSVGAGESGNPESDGDSESDDNSDSDGGDSSSAGTSFEQSTDELLFELPDGWSLETESFGQTLGYLLSHEDNAAIEAELIADYPDAGLVSPFFSLSLTEGDSIFIGAPAAREDSRIQQLGNIEVQLAPSPLEPDSVWGDSWNSLDDVVAFSEWAWPGASEPAAREVEIAGAPGLAFFPTDDPAFRQFYYVVATADTQQMRITVYPSNSVHADDVAAIIDSIEKGAPGSRYAS